MKLLENTARGHELDRLRLKNRLLNHILENQRRREQWRRIGAPEQLRPLSQPIVEPRLETPALCVVTPCVVTPEAG